MRRPLLLLPGPMQVPDPIRAAGDRPLFSHRSAQMEALLSKLEEGSRPIFGTKGNVIFLASSGTGAMADRIRDLIRRTGMEVYALKPGNGITAVIPPRDSDRRRSGKNKGHNISNWPYRPPLGRRGGLFHSELEHCLD